MDLVVYDTSEGVAVGAAQRIAELIAATADRFSLGLAGGSTPVATYEALRGRATGWGKVDAWLSDERWVPTDDDRSNGRMADETLMSHVPARFVRPRWSEFLEPADSAAHYEAALRSLHDRRRPDLILLGMGEDAHTASLFPGSAALDQDQRWYVANEIPETGEPRLTATYPLLWHAQRLMVITAGEHKAPALRDSFAGTTPAGRIGEGDAEVEWHVDTAA
ncbi:MAG TPA: 6-phosphogluconolactonase, partial [Acidimicrobiia bacterium]|nr:6-phosphogluconolactonase [Acidimicrobiia bacterium]